MSSFRFNDTASGQALFEQVPSPGVFKLKEGHFWNDVTQKNILTQLNGQAGSLVQAINVNNTPVTATNPSSAADLMTLALPAGYTSITGKTLYVWGSGSYTTAGGQTPTFTLVLKIGTLSLLTLVTAATTASVTKTWNIEGFITTVTAGAAGTYEAHGLLGIELGGGAAGSVAATGINDAIVAVSSTLDLTAAQTLKLTGLFSSSNAGNNIVQRQMVVQVLN
jgi:hypothetical protein